MDKEQNLTIQNDSEASRISIADILYVLRAHLIFIIIVCLLFSAGGFAYSKLKKPVYTASVPVQFKTEMFTIDPEGEGSGTPKVNQVSSTNYLFNYLDTAVGICSSGEVIDRANVYYNYYLQFKRDNPDKGIDDFIADLRSKYTDDVKLQRLEIEGYEATDAHMEACRDKWFNSGNVGTSYSSGDSDSVIFFRLWVKNLNLAYAKEMVRIYVLAADFYLNSTLDFGTGTSGLIELARSQGSVAWSTDASTKKTVVLSFIMGLAISFAAIYIKHLVDNTVKSKEQLEEISGVSVIAYIEDIAEAK